MAGPHENLETAEHAEHAAHSNKKIALLISVLALFLAFSETLGKSAQTSAITLNVTSNDLWSFFQAKTIRTVSYTHLLAAMSRDSTVVASKCANEVAGAGSVRSSAGT